MADRLGSAVSPESLCLELCVGDEMSRGLIPFSIDFIESRKSHAIQVLYQYETQWSKVPQDFRTD